MKELIGMVVGLCVALLVLRFVPAIALLIQLLRMRIGPMRVIPGMDPGNRQPGEAAALRELLALGFEHTGTQHIESAAQRTDSLWLRHPTLPAFASLTFRPSPHTGYPVGFFSFANDGRVLLTSNRAAWATLASDAALDEADPCAASLAEHWQAHRARISGLMPAALSSDEARGRVAALWEGYFPLLQSRRRIRPHHGAWHLTAACAGRAVWAWWRVRRRLQSPYSSPITSGEGQVEHYARLYEQSEAERQDRPARRDVKAWLLLVTGLASLLLFGVRFNWTSALDLVVILLVHEAGHALAMRCFGYRDVTMFFVPLVGAMVTGTPKDLAAWKQAAMLFAGPLPGLLAGAAALGLSMLGVIPPLGRGGTTFATLAVFINLFNLLPITPLDGGRLVELAVFARWPRLRIAFAGLGVAALATIAFWQRHPSPVFLVVVAFAGVAVRHQVTMVRLQRAWKDGLTTGEQVRTLFAAARTAMRTKSFARQCQMVRAVMIQRAVRPARAWESAATLALLCAIWAATGVGVHAAHLRRAVEHADPRTVAQQDFDSARMAFEDDPNESSARLLRKSAARLTKHDARRVDLRVLLALHGPADQRWPALESILRSGRRGRDYGPEAIEAAMLEDVSTGSAQRRPAERVALLGAAITRLEPFSQGHEGGLIDGRLRLAEAIDLAGDPARAAQLLGQIRASALTNESCGCHLQDVVEASAWFQISRGHAAQAVSELETSSFASKLANGRGPSLEYAWALLESGQVAAGVEQMRHSAYLVPARANEVSGALSVAPRAALLSRPLDMAYALQRAGRGAEARALIAAGNDWACAASSQPGQGILDAGPWRRFRRERLASLARSVCPAPSLATNP